MLNSQDNETLVRVGPGTAMGQLMRLYWIPFLASADVERDGQPLPLPAQFSGRQGQAAADAGLVVATSFLADRAYDDQGLLVPRKLPDSVIKDEATVLRRVRQLLETGTVTTYSGTTLTMPVRSILVHGDTPGAVSLARLIRDSIEAVGGRIVPISKQAGLVPKG